MNKKLPLISLFIMSIVSIFYWVLKPKEELHEAKWNAPDTTLAITINGEISTTFPTTKDYTATVECTIGTGTVEWNGTKWILTTSGIASGNVKCNALFQGVPDGWYDAEDGTILAALRENNALTKSISVPGKESSTGNEAVFASTEDDYGTSYYFRGAVKNNYVQFADKCWRIVRVTGDGSIKLVLHNNNDAGVTNPCGKENNTDQAAFIGVSNFNSYSGNVGYMYGVDDSTDYATKFANDYISNILSDLIDFYPSDYDDLLADVIWCNDKSYTLKSSGNSDVYPRQRYGAGDRLIMLHKPSLICPSDNNGGKLSKYTVNDTENGNGNLEYKIGLLTADELAFAGYYAAEYPDNPNTYLKENAIGSWWTMSPGGFSNIEDSSIIILFSSENEESFTEAIPGSNGDEFDSSVQIRPSIALVSTVKVTGSGTSDDPYVVE